MYENENWHEPRQGTGDGELCARCPTCDRRYFKLIEVGASLYCERCLHWQKGELAAPLSVMHVVRNVRVRSHVAWANEIDQHIDQRPYRLELAFPKVAITKSRMLWIGPKVLITEDVQMQKWERLFYKREECIAAHAEVVKRLRSGETVDEIAAQMRLSGLS